jgi:hypothetical protein
VNQKDVQEFMVSHPKTSFAIAIALDAVACSLLVSLLWTVAHADETRQYYDAQGHVVASSVTSKSGTTYYDDRGHAVVSSTVHNNLIDYYDSRGVLILSVPSSKAPDAFPIPAPQTAPQPGQ